MQCNLRALAQGLLCTQVPKLKCVAFVSIPLEIKSKRMQLRTYSCTKTCKKNKRIFMQIV